MKYLRALYVRVWDWWRPIYYGRLLKRPNVRLDIHDGSHGHSSLTIGE